MFLMCSKGKMIECPMGEARFWAWVAIALEDQSVQVFEQRGLLMTPFDPIKKEI